MKGFEDLSLDLHDEYQSILGYFEEIYVGKYWVDAKVSADFFSFLCFKFLLKQNTINQQRIYHCYL